jgi:hypothetical protein
MLIRKMLNELKTNEEARERFNKLACTKNSVWSLERLIGGYWNGKVDSTPSLFNLIELEQRHVIQTLLSRTPDGKAVMEFLDVELKYNKIIKPTTHPELIRALPKTLRELLYTKFTTALYNGKSLEEAINIIEDIYAEYAN